VLARIDRSGAGKSSRSRFTGTARDDETMAGARIAVRVQARARRDEVAFVRDGVLVVRVTAPALEGRANRAVRRMLAQRLGVAPNRVTIVRGERSRDKLLEVSGVDQPAADAALGLS
jgi:uncharacterized protein (TIGR00251 family)